MPPPSQDETPTIPTLIEPKHKTKWVLGVLAIVTLLVLLILGAIAFLSTKPVNIAQAVSEASFIHYDTQGSLRGFCNNPVLNDVRVSNYEVTCNEDGDAISISIHSAGETYLCRSGAHGVDEANQPKRGIVCLKINEEITKTLEDSIDSNATVMPETTSITTLTTEPPMCPVANNFNTYRENAGKVTYGVKVGVYGNSYSDRGTLLAINEDRTVCACRQPTNPSTGSSFYYGIINDEGYIEWDLASDDDTTSISDTIKTFVTFENTISGNKIETVRSLDIDSKGCGSWEMSWLPKDLNPELVCGCGNKEQTIQQQSEVESRALKAQGSDGSVSVNHVSSTNIYVNTEYAISFNIPINWSCTTRRTHIDYPDWHQTVCYDQNNPTKSGDPLMAISVPVLEEDMSTWSESSESVLNTSQGDVIKRVYLSSNDIGLVEYTFQGSNDQKSYRAFTLYGPDKAHGNIEAAEKSLEPIIKSLNVQ